MDVLQKGFGIGVSIGHIVVHAPHVEPAWHVVYKQA